MPKRAAGALIFLFFVLACDGESEPTPPAEPAALSIVAGNNQTGAAGAALPQPITVRVDDGGGDPLSGVSVSFSAMDGSISPGSATTGPDGRASTTWTLGPAAGAQEASASVGGLSASFSATAEAGEAAVLTIGRTLDAFTALGDTAWLSVTAADEFGNDLAAPVVAWSSTDDGVATVDAAGVVTAAGNGSARIVAMSGAAADTVDVTVSQAVAAFALSAPDTRIGWSEVVQLSGDAVDANGHAVTNATIAWSTEDGTIAAVDGQGVATGEGLGTVDITAEVESFSESVTLTVTPLPRATLAKGQMSGCLLDEVGTAFCWGRNLNGELGNGSDVDSNTPVAVAGGHRFVFLATGPGHHHCALTEAGAAYCWGANFSGQLGDGTMSSSAVPVAVAGGLTFRRIAVGASQTCAVDRDGAAYCWGANASGQLGDGTTADHAVPAPVSTGVTFSEIATGQATTCALAGSDAYCWGANAYGQVGNGSTGAAQTTPAAVAGGHAFHRVSVGGLHACGIGTDGAAHCWGNNGSGQLGDGTYTTTSTPVSVHGLTEVTDLSAGLHATCATASGQAYCWGAGMLGDGEPGHFMADQPTTVAGGLSWRLIRAGDYLACGATTDGGAYCWGQSQYAGDGSTLMQTTPAAVLGGHTFATIDAGADFTCATTTSEDAYCWGDNSQGRLGIGDPYSNPRATPTRITAVSLAEVFAGADHACGLTADGTAYCWGGNNYGQLGDGTTTPHDAPVPVDAAFAFDQLSVGDYHTCGIRASDGSAYCWGDNGAGRLGDGTTTNRPSPTPVAGAPAFALIAAGGNHSCALTGEGAAYCWGANVNGQLGDGTTTDRHAPAPVSGGLVLGGIATGTNYTCALSPTGEGYCWGSNAWGRLGDGTYTDRLTPTPASGTLTYFTGGTGVGHACAITPAGAAYCWGLNADGQLGIGTLEGQPTPTAVQGGHAMVAVSAGQRHTCGIAADGGALCWGFAGSGELGNGVAEIVNDPRQVAGGLVLPLP